MTISYPLFAKMKMTDENGFYTDEAQRYHDVAAQSSQQMTGYFNNGIPFPSKTTAEITALEPNSRVGTVWFNSTLAKLQVKTASGTIETITSS